jgi:hypothetical protein
MINQLYSNFCIFYNSPTIGGGHDSGVAFKSAAEVDIGVSRTADAGHGGERIDLNG